jgi:hypothetical protein
MTGPKFNVVIIYEDKVAGKRAKHFYDRVIRELADECDLSSRRASEQNVSFVDDPYPERLSPPDRRDATPWQSFVGVGMSSRNSKDEDYFSDHPKRQRFFDGLFRSEAQLTLKHFSRTLERQSGKKGELADDRAAPSSR